MYYVHQNMTDKNQVIGEFNTQEEAIAYMEYKAMRPQAGNVIGYAVRDYSLKTITEWEI